jgi:hypothetical protein
MLCLIEAFTNAFVDRIYFCFTKKKTQNKASQENPNLINFWALVDPYFSHNHVFAAPPRLSLSLSFSFVLSLFLSQSAAMQLLVPSRGKEKGDTSFIHGR